MVTNENKFHLEFNNDKQWNSDSDDDNCSCNSCECSSCTDDEENILKDNKTISINSPQSINLSTIRLIRKSYYSTTDVSHRNDSYNNVNKYNHFSMNSNHPSINQLKESNMRSSETKKDTMNISDKFISTKQINEEIIEDQSSTDQKKSEHFQSIENNKTDKHESSEIDLEHIYELIDQSYTKIPILYNSIKQAKLDTDFVLSVNNYLDRLKANIYKDLIRHETLLRNGKNHAQNLISLIRCICKISYEQALEIPNDSMTSKRAVLYTMTAIDYILQENFPQKKPLFNYILNEYISMWLHENLRIIQEDFSIIGENGTKTNFFVLCICLFHKLESICAINWERLQMIQNYRLIHFNQLMKPTSIKLEKNQDFLLYFGKPLMPTMKKSHLPVTSLYSNRTDNEMNNINEMQQIFRNSIAKILLQQSSISKNNLTIEDEKLGLRQLHPQSIVTPIIEITSSTSINIDVNSKNKEISQTSKLDENQPMIKKHEINQSKPDLPMVDQQNKPISNIISEIYTQSIEPVLLPRHPSATSSLSDKAEERQRSSHSESKLVSLEYQQSSVPIETILKKNTSATSNFIYPNQSSSPSNSSLSHSQLSTKTKSIIQTAEPISISKRINQCSESSSNTSIFITSESQNNAQQIQDLNDAHSSINLLSIDHSIKEITPLTFSSPETPTMNAKTILNTEVNALINFLKELAYSSLSVQQEKKTSPPLNILQSCLKQSTTDPNSIIEQVQNTHPQLTANEKDPLFLAEFTRVLHKELRDEQILRKIDCIQSKEDSQNIDHLSCEINNILKLLKIDQTRVIVEVIHDPSKCAPNSEFSDHQCQPCILQQQQQHQPFNYYSPLSKTTHITVCSTESDSQQSSESNHTSQQWYGVYSNKSFSCKDCTATPNSLF